MNGTTSAQLGWRWQLPVVFGVVLLCFLAVSGFTHWRLLEIDRASLDIAENAAPSIEKLAAARAESRRLQVLLREHIDKKAAGAPTDLLAIEESRRSLDDLITEYLSLPIFPGEQELWGDILRPKNALHESVARVLADTEHGELERAHETLRTEVATSADRLGTAITRDTEFNATHAHDLAVHIRRVRDQTMSAAAGLDAICAFVTVVGGFALYRAMRGYADLMARHQRLMEERGAELEAFAGRVAHDILSPLSAVAFALPLAGGSGPEEERKRYVVRGARSLERVRRLVSGLLEFARAGAKPDAATHAEVAETLADLVGDLQSEAREAGAQLDVRSSVTSAVVCNPGVLTSLIANLAHNAIKYIGEGPLRRVEIRALDRGESVRVEVEDTGLGLPPGLESHVFDPYVRGPDTTKAGIGLGLATVKRLAEAHGGRVGVRSVPGEGCTFWFELPKAQGEERAPAVATTSMV